MTASDGNSTTSGLLDSSAANRRPDEIVVANDLQEYLGVDRYNHYLAPFSNQQVSESLADATALLYPKSPPRSCLDLLNRPAQHQRVSDRICAIAIATLSEDNLRAPHIRNAIRFSSGSSRTNYQFVRLFLRRKLAQQIRSADLNLNAFPDLFPSSIVDLIQGKRGKPFNIDSAKNLLQSIRSVARDTGIATAGAAANDLLNYIHSLIFDFPWFFKGEFTHYLEYRQIFLELSRRGVPIGVMLDKQSRCEEIRKDLHDGERAEFVFIGLKTRQSPFRYYVIGDEYLIMLCGRKDQFTVFWGSSSRGLKAIRELGKYDFREMASNNKIFVSKRKQNDIYALPK